MVNRFDESKNNLISYKFYAGPQGRLVVSRIEKYKKRLAYCYCSISLLSAALTGTVVYILNGG